MESDRYRTVAGAARVKIAVDSCRFIAPVAPVETEKEARAFILSVSREFAHATYNEYAYG